MEGAVSKEKIRIGTHGEDYGNWMSNPVFYMLGALLALFIVLTVMSFTLLRLKVLGVIFAIVSVLLLIMLGWITWIRRQYAFTPLFKRVPPAFGSCAVKIRSRRMEPPESARGMIARTYLYMEWAYQMPLLGVMKRKLMQEWNAAYPVTQAECQRAFLIESLQKNEQPFVKTPCVQAGLWPRSKDV